MTTLPCCALNPHPFCLACRCFHHMPARYDAGICQVCDATLRRQGRRRCKTCGEIKPLVRFQQSAGKYYRDCLSCRAARNRARDRAYQRAHAAERAVRRKAAYDKDPARTLAQNRASYQRTRAKRIASSLAWRARNRERHRATTRAWYARNRARATQAQRAYYQRRKLAAFWGTR